MSEYKELVEALKTLGNLPAEEIPKDVKDLMKSIVKEEKPEVKSEIKPYVNAPRLPNFSGKDKPGSGEVTYDLWRYELVCLINDKTHSKELITQSVRRALRGDAGKVVMRLGPNAQLSQIIDKMDSVFGFVEEKESVMREFYNATQHEDEDVTTWSFRLEDILEKAIQTGKVSRPDADGMLHDMLWKGLRPHLKSISHYEKEKYTTFDALRVALRRIEKDNNLDTPPPKCTKGTSKKTISKTNDDKDDDDEGLKGILKSINSRLNRLEMGPQQYQQPQSRSYYSGRGRGRGYRGNYRGNSRSTYTPYRGNDTNDSKDSQQPRKPIYCHRCGQEGHMARGCFNKPGQYKTLNAKESTPRGRK